MSKLSFLARNIFKYRVSVLSPIRRVTSRSFSSAEGEQGQPQPAEWESQEPPADPLFEEAVFAKLIGFGRDMLKTDIIHFLDGSNLSTSDVKFQYNNSFFPISMMLRFSSQSCFDTALRLALRKGRLYKLDKIDSGQWDIAESHDGRTVLVEGIPRNAVREDIERFLSGCNYDASSFRYINRPGVDAIKAVSFRVASGLEAMNFRIRKNRSLCLNAPVTVRVLQ